MKQMLVQTFNLDICAKFRLDQINDSIFTNGVYPNIDNIVKNSNLRLIK